MKILFIGNSRLGDAILSTGLLNKFNKPCNNITLVSSSLSMEIYESFPCVKKTIIIKKKKYSSHWIDVYKKLDSITWDIVIDLRNSIVTRIIKKKKIYRFFKDSSEKHKLEVLSNLIRSKKILSPKIYTKKEHKDEARFFLKNIKPKAKILAIAPVTNWQRKNWPIKNFSLLINKIIENKHTFKISDVIIFGSSSEKKMCENLKKEITSKNVYNFSGNKKILTIFEIMKSCEVFIGNDSGLSHLAAVSKIKTLALFGPSKENKYRPWGANSHFIRTNESFEELINQPNYSRFDKSSLMKSLSMDKVYEKLKLIML